LWNDGHNTCMLDDDDDDDDTKAELRHAGEKR